MGENGELQALRAECAADGLGFGGRPALLAAARTAQASTVELLLSWGVDPDSRDSKELTAAFYAVTMQTEHGADPGEQARLATIRVLARGGADLDAVARSGDTVLHLAAGEGLGEIVDFLLSEGVDSSVQGENGETAAERAERNGYRDIARMIRRH